MSTCCEMNDKKPKTHRPSGVTDGLAKIHVVICICQALIPCGFCPTAARNNRRIFCFRRQNLRELVHRRSIIVFLLSSVAKDSSKKAWAYKLLYTTRHLLTDLKSFVTKTRCRSNYLLGRDATPASPPFPLWPPATSRFRSVKTALVYEKLKEPF